MTAAARSRLEGCRNVAVLDRRKIPPRLDALQGELGASLRVAQDLRVGEADECPADALHFPLPPQIIGLNIRALMYTAIQLNRRLRLWMRKIDEASLDLPIYYIALFKLLN